jgi:hypothetical protein
VQVHCSEGLANHTGPESCADDCREAVREALTGMHAGQPSSGVKSVRSADALEKAEGNMDRRVKASAGPAPRRLRPWHVCKSPAREPGGLRHRPGGRPQGRIGKAGGRSR